MIFYHTYKSIDFNCAFTFHEKKNWKNENKTIIDKDCKISQELIILLFQIKVVPNRFIIKLKMSENTLEQLIQEYNQTQEKDESYIIKQMEIISYNRFDSP